MVIAKVGISGTLAYTMFCGTITKGMTGAQVAIEYTDPLWDGLTKTVVFRYGKKILDVVDAGELVTIPAEMTAECGRHRLCIGVYGVDATGSLVIPTVYTSLGMVEDAADPSGDESTDPALAVWAQILGKIGDLDDLNTEAKDTLVAAINESLTKGGAVDEAAVQKMVEDYLAANPPGITEIPIATDKTLGGVKVGTDLKVTQDGTLSVDSTGAVEETDLRPITSQAVYSEFGKIVALLNTI